MFLVKYKYETSKEDDLLSFFFPYLTGHAEGEGGQILDQGQKKMWIELHYSPDATRNHPFGGPKLLRKSK